MFCSKCGSQIVNNDALFCSRCGSKVVFDGAGTGMARSGSGSDTATFDVVGKLDDKPINRPVNGGTGAVETFDVVRNPIMPIYSQPNNHYSEAVETFDVIRDPIPPKRAPINKPIYLDVSDDIKRSNNAKTIVVVLVACALCLTLVCGIAAIVDALDTPAQASNTRSSSNSYSAPEPKLPEPRNEQVILAPNKFERLLGEAGKISAREMNDLYNANKIGYENRIGGKYFIVTGRISQIRPAYIGSTSIVELSTPDWNDDIRVVYPENISDVEREYVGALRTGYGFEAFVRGQTNRPGYVDVVCKSVGGQVRTVTFNPTPPPTTGEYGRAAAEYLSESVGQDINEAAEFLGGFLEGLLGQ